MKKTSPIIAQTGSDKSPAPIPGELCPDEMALLIQVNRRTITRWEKERIISKRGRNFPTVLTIQSVLVYFQNSNDQKIRKLRIENDSKQTSRFWQPTFCDTEKKLYSKTIMKRSPESITGDHVEQWSKRQKNTGKRCRDTYDFMYCEIGLRQLV